MTNRLFQSIAFLFMPLSLLSQQVDTNMVKPVFKDGQAQVVPAFANSADWIKEELWVETTFDSDYDGKPDRMHVFVTRPMQTSTQNVKLPVIYMSSPYFGLSIKNLIGLGGNKYNWKVNHELGELPSSRKHTHFKTRTKRPLLANMYEQLWVPRGYVMVFSSSPGTGLSDGAPTIGGENEALAPKAVIDWLCGRAKAFTTRYGNAEVKASWCSGNIGMTGTSYDGTLCLAAATTGVAGLKAIIPVAPVSSFYHYYRSNGLVRSPDGYLGEDADVMYDAINTGKKSNRTVIDVVVRDNIIVKGMDRKTGDYNAFWDERDLLKKIDNVQAAMLMAHGFNDWNVMADQSYRVYKAAKEKGLPVQLYYHQDGHGGNPPLRMMNRWFTKYLHEIDNQVELDTPVAIKREHARVTTKYLEFPDADAHDVSLYLKAGPQGDGQLTTSKQDENTAMRSFTDDFRIAPDKLHVPANAQHRLLFLTPPLKEDVRISGIPKISLTVSADKPAANVSVYLITLPRQEGKGVEVYDNLINRTWADPQNHQSLTQGERLEPGYSYTLNIEFMPDDQIIPKGKQIGLMIFSSDKEFTLHPKPGTQLSVAIDQCELILPVVGGVLPID